MITEVHEIKPVFGRKRPQSGDGNRLRTRAEQTAPDDVWPLRLHAGGCPGKNRCIPKFNLNLPTMPLPSTGAQFLNQTDQSDRRVLLVDRHSHARDSLRLMLSTLGITKVHGAGSSVEAMRLVKANEFDIIFSDYQLEDGRDGQQLLEELRLQHLIALSTVFIIVTSERGYHNVVSVAELTPDDYLVKPFTADQLHNRLGRALQRKSVLSKVYRLLDAAAYSKALAACDQILDKGDEFFLDTLRLRGEILSALGKHQDAEALYREVLATRPIPWAKMGLANALLAGGNRPEATTVLQTLVEAHPHFMAAHDLLAKVLEAGGDLAGAQEALARAAAISPHNTVRLRAAGDVAARNGDLDAAEKAYQTALDRTRGSSVVRVDDYANLTRVLLDKGKTALAKSVAKDLRRERRGDAAGELAALTLESLCYRAEDDNANADQSLQQALALREQSSVAGNRELEKVSVDLAHACLVAGKEDEATALLRTVAMENPDDPTTAAAINRVFDKLGRVDQGQTLLNTVNNEIAGINNESARIAREGDLEGAVQLLTDAAERMPNLKFLVSASNAVFSLLDRQGWQNERAEQGLRYLIKAQLKKPRDPAVVAAGERMQQVAHKYGISVGNLRQQAIDALAAGR
jgi:DNA-binding response OmpR family regulator/Flp pilus assembly protein TadD